MDIQSEVTELIKAELPSSDAARLGPTDDLLEEGLLDSAAIAMLVSYVEERFDLEISNDELVPENFRTIETISAFVETKIGARSLQG